MRADATQLTIRLPKTGTIEMKKKIQRLGGGANSLFKYRDAIKGDLDQSARDEAIKWLDAYNRDDVKATFAVRDYMRSLS